MRLHLSFSQIDHYKQLIRFDRPIGTLLLLWPTLCALWLASGGSPQISNLIIFSLGCLVMRSAGCVINDYADRKVDGDVARTKDRPIAAGNVGATEALQLFALLGVIAFGLVLLTNALTIQLAFVAMGLAALYPFMKRYTHWPQLVLGAAFGMATPMAYAAEMNSLPVTVWLLFCINVAWTVAYDTFYAMTDREDDIKIGIKSTAVLFGEFDRIITGTLQVIVLLGLGLLGRMYFMGNWYYLAWLVIAALFAYQQYLIKDRDPQQCLQAFLNNNYVGAVLFAGIAADFALQ